MVQIFHNILRHSDVPVHPLLWKNGKKQGICGWVWRNVSCICWKRIPDVELRKRLWLRFNL